MGKLIALKLKCSDMGAFPSLLAFTPGELTGEAVFTAAFLIASPLPCKQEVPPPPTH